MTTEPRPTPIEYNMELAVQVASRSNCLRSHVGALILFDGRIRAVGYNGTIEAYPDCFEGGCARCRDMTIKRGIALDRCVCVHGEENALVSAARFGIEVDGADMFVTHEPCLSCTKLVIQAGIKNVVWLKRYEYLEDAGDQEKSRDAMREHSRLRGMTTFKYVEELADAGKPRVRGIDTWTDRLDAMKKAAEDHARELGVLIEN